MASPVDGWWRTPDEPQAVSTFVQFLRRPDGPFLAAPDSTSSSALNMPRPGWRDNSDYGPLSSKRSAAESEGSFPTAAFRGRPGTSVALHRRDRPRVVAGSVHADVGRGRGLARHRVTDRVPGVPPQSAAHPGLRTVARSAGGVLKARRLAIAEPAMDWAFAVGQECRATNGRKLGYPTIRMSK